MTASSERAAFGFAVAAFFLATNILRELVHNGSLSAEDGRSVVAKAGAVNPNAFPGGPEVLAFARDMLAVALHGVDEAEREAPKPH